jgi:sulfite reductase alpha subunit-like flavoprotein
MKWEPPVEPPEGTSCSQIKEPHPDVETPVDMDLPTGSDISILDGHEVRLMANIRQTPESHWQDVRELTFIMNDAYEYEPGDTLSIYPKNFPLDVQALIDLQDWSHVADKPLRFASGPPDYFDAQDLLELVPQGLRLTKSMTLRDLLTCHLDITAIPKRFFLHSIAHHTDDATHKERLLEFTNPAFTDEFYDYTT